MKRYDTLQGQLDDIHEQLREIGWGIWHEVEENPWGTALLFIAFWLMFLGLYLAAGG